MDGDAVMAWLLIGGVVLGAVLVVRAQQEQDRETGPKIRCPHCEVTGQVRVTRVSRKRGISGGKASGAVVTGGLSVLLTGLSRRQEFRHLVCGNCGMEWDVA